MGLGGPTARLDGRLSQSLRLPLPAAVDRQPDEVVDQEPGWIHRDLARVSQPGTIDFQFDGAADTWSGWINNFSSFYSTYHRV